MGTWRQLTAVAAVLLVAASCGGVSDEPASTTGHERTEPPPTATADPPGSTVPTHHVSFRTSGGNEQWAPNLCDDGEHCLTPYTVTSTLTGDLEGSLRSTGAFALNDEGTFDVMDLSSFTGTVAGCGTGTLVIERHLVATGTDGSVDWRVATEWGTGDLTTVTGGGRSPAALDPAESSLYEGDLACPKG